MIVRSPELCAKPIVSVLTTVYNHEPFLRRCLDSILSQNTDFEFEIVIGEDCSSDSSRAICKEYQERYPEKITLILHEENQGLIENYLSIVNELRGKYVAVCSGDDYWLDADKLSKQVAVMACNSNAVLCFTEAIEDIWGENGIEQSSLFGEMKDQEYTGEDILTCVPIVASTVMFLNNAIDLTFLRHQKFYAEDLVMYLKFCEVGKAYGMSVVTTGYTVHSMSIMQSLCGNIEKNAHREIEYREMIDVETKGKYHDILMCSMSRIAYKCGLSLIKKGQYGVGLRFAFKSLTKKPILFFEMLWKSVLY